VLVSNSEEKRMILEKCLRKSFCFACPERNRKSCCNNMICEFHFPVKKDKNKEKKGMHEKEDLWTSKVFLLFQFFFGERNKKKEINVIRVLQSHQLKDKSKHREKVFAPELSSLTSDDMADETESAA
jgi:hypothetical protein